MDLPLDREITLPLVEGKYYLDQYISSYSQDYERRNMRRTIHIEQGTIPEINYKVYVSEKKWKRLKQKQAKQKRRSKKKVGAKEDNKTIIPLQIY